MTSGRRESGVPYLARVALGAARADAGDVERLLALGAAHHLCVWDRVGVVR